MSVLSSRSFLGGLPIWLLFVWAGAALAQPSPARVALLAGVNQYDKRYFAERPLQFAERDVEHMADELKKNGFTVKLLKGSLSGRDRATKANIDAALGEMLTGRSSSDIVLIGFAGHGQQLPLRSEKGEALIDGAGKQMEDAYFCPVDAALTEPDSMVSLTKLIQTLDVKGGVNLVLVDACRDNADPARGSRSISGNELNGRLPRNTALYFSCAAGQQALETDKAGGGHGVFFYHVLKGLQGDAINSRGEVTWSTLVDYVRENTDEQAKAWFPERMERAVTGRLQTPHELRNLIEMPVLARVTPRAPAVKPDSPSSGPPPAENFNEISSRALGMKLKLIPKGEFLMGSTSEQLDGIVADHSDAKREKYEDELPQHRVRISQPFYLGIYEVTQAEFTRVMGINPSGFAANGPMKEKVDGLNTDRFPVEQVSWFDAIEFCNKLSIRDGLPQYYTMSDVERDPMTRLISKAQVNIAGGSGYRLPTEAEWEYACRAGTTTHFHFGNASNGRESNIDGNYPLGTTVKGPFLDRPTDVGNYPPNAFGLRDMHGNVWEWCFDSRDANNYKTPDSLRIDPINPLSENRVVRGGSWYDIARGTRSAYRGSSFPHTLDDDTGFRVARNP